MCMSRNGIDILYCIPQNGNLYVEYDVNLLNHWILGDSFVGRSRLFFSFVGVPLNLHLKMILEKRSCWVECPLANRDLS